MSIKNKLKAIKALLSSVKLSQEPLVDGTLIEYSGDQISANEVIYKVEGADSINVLPDGAYITKSQQNFTITQGVVSAVSPKATTPETKTGPVLQAQSSQTETQTEKVEETKVEETEKKEDKVELSDAAVTVDINSVISSALSPVWDAIYSIQRSLENLATLYVSQENFSKVNVEFNKTQQAISKLTDVVNIIAKEPAGSPIEVEFSNANSGSKIPQSDKETMTYKVMQGLHSPVQK